MTSSHGDTFQCELCPKSFAEKRYLTKHVKRLHPDGKVKKKKDNSMQCPICKKVFPRYSHLSRHQLSCMNIRSFECPFCDNKFQQKIHLLRHVGRKHPQEDRTKLDEILLNFDIKKIQKGEDSQPTTSRNCQDLIHRHLCLKCCHIFTDKHDLLRHIRNTHQPIVCHHCNRIFYGNASLKKHELMTRTSRYTCTCGASFSTIRVLKNHENACRRRGEFMCIQDECKQLFCQRVQLDRHWNKIHFTLKKCQQCSFTASAPLKLARHMEIEHLIKICGFCGEENPDEKHVSTYHWKRLKRTVALVKKARKTRDSKDAVKQEELEEKEKEEEEQKMVESPVEEEKTDEMDEEDDSDDQPSLRIDESYEEPSPSLSPPQSRPSPPKQQIAKEPIEQSQVEKTAKIEDQFDGEVLMPLPSYEISEEPSIYGDEMYNQSQENGSIPELSFSTMDPDSVIINLVIQIPNQCTRLILSDFLTPELALNFPELSNTSVVISEDFQGRLLSLFIPVAKRANSQKWMEEPIYL